MELGDSIIGLLPLLVSGYLFNLIFYPFRFFTGRADGQRLFFMSAGSGLVIGGIAFALSYWISTAVKTIRLTGWLPRTLTQIHHMIPISWIGSLLLTLLLGPILAILGNVSAYIFMKLVSKSNIKTARWIYGKMNSWFGSPLAQLLREAADEQKLVLINLCSRKVYCGRIMEAPFIVDGDNSYIEVLPKFSTYRDKETLEMNKSVLNYPAFNLWESMRYRDERKELLSNIESQLEAPNKPIFARDPPSDDLNEARLVIIEEISEIEKTIDEVAPMNFNVRDWIKVIPCNEVESASFFDSDAFDTWFSDADETEHPNHSDVASAER